MSDTMRAFVLEGHGDFDKLVYHENWPKPVAGPGEVLIHVHACGLNNTDINTRTGWYSKGVTGETTGSTLETAEDDDAAWGGSPITFPRIQGADGVGIVEAVGEGVDTALIGRRVMVDVWQRDWNDPQNMNKCGYFGSEVDGGYADYAKVNVHNVHPVDSDLSHAELATFATSYVTAENMLDRAQVRAGDTVLITGASGGVGSGLIQLVKRRGAQTIAICGRSKMNAVKAVGADFVIPRDVKDFGHALKDIAGLDQVSVLADLVGGEDFPQLIELLERGGRYTCSGAIGGPIVDLDLRTLYLKDLTFTGATIVPVGTFARLVKYIEDGEIRPLLAKTFPLADLHDAQRMFIAKEHVGNIVVTM